MSATKLFPNIEDVLDWLTTDDYVHREDVEAARQELEAAQKLVAAAELQVLNFKRQQAGDNFLGDDDHEAWTALDAALADCRRSRT